MRRVRPWDKAGEHSAYLVMSLSFFSAALHDLLVWHLVEKQIQFLQAIPSIFSLIWPCSIRKAITKPP